MEKTKNPTFHLGFTNYGIIGTDVNQTNVPLHFSAKHNIMPRNTVTVLSCFLAFKYRTQLQFYQVRRNEKLTLGNSKRKWEAQKDKLTLAYKNLLLTLKCQTQRRRRQQQ